MFGVRPSLRRLAGLGLVAALSMPGAALAAPSTHLTEHRIDVGGGLRHPDAVVFLQLGVSSAFGTTADVQVWLPPDVDYLHPPTLVSGRAELVVAPDDSSLAGSVDLYFRETGEFAGRAVIDASFAPLGPAVPNNNAGSGNHKERREEIIQPMSVTGTLTVPGRSNAVVLPLDDLLATVADREQFTNDPSSTVFDQQYTAMELWWAVDGLLVGIKGESDKDISWVESAVILPDGTIINGAHEGATVDHRRIEADVAIAAVNPGLAASHGTVVVRADVSRGDTQRSLFEDGDDRLRLEFQQLVASGTVHVALDDGTELSLDFADAVGSFGQVTIRYRDGGRDG
ncbi:MAG TPA: hypothetical protein VHK06_03300 [Candidatus Limnocylindria bacterium]|nr:hypothetical protein [Candidatus Limnocylindria bacterium]